MDKKDIEDVVELTVQRLLDNGLGKAIDDRIYQQTLECAKERAARHRIERKSQGSLFWKIATFAAILLGALVDYFN